ncbi:kinesin-like protein KIN-12E isoform X3 [Brachypodium distachyon]|uniref:kinesin-like protein KIN-12E isoform X3 n=1 Tax=Brachypodium distachyon TaxID=15368 RepID=UPI000D0DDC52|nr:kinesin-like protein KIN-12E isoform X3 [Brachypodium distachyon]|eukprot:XP_024313758.1 kinesin-like protein KIN-12E isoform X3 [Brachypodium distachyon]
MAAPGGGGRRGSTSRASRRAAPEPNENDDAPPTFGPAPPPFSLPPRSPLAAIADPGRNPRSAPATPKSSLAGTPRAGAVPPGVRDRSSSIGAGRRVFDLRDLAAAEVPVDVPHFELDEDPAFWMDRNVQVLVRMRPISAAESSAHGQKRCLMQDSPKTLSWTGHPETMFTFDHVACETISQEKLFRVVGLPMVENCMSGYNGCLFAYGQTGSGKTYTMMGELSKEARELNDDSGLTPRIFEYLFARIKEEEERRREDNLKYICKCSFLEIYNEQITDLLEPSSTNLQIREDIKKGVYVENLMECYVSSVKDVMLLLLQGVANRKMAATNMNSESSRSHSVFTCVIESHWEKDSMTHLRFGRLNLVDLAGSERQKSSGAEGERLKEAANINRSLSTLGLVIMTLVDVANGKTRHVPYRDSRLTFLLQDSLGGNSKTTIVANVSPSICSSNESLSTLKFAQRAKLIQNNAKVNEDASGDVMALQRQIEELKDQLTCLRKQQNVPGSHSFHLLNSGSENEYNTLSEDHQSGCDMNLLKQKQVSHLEDVLVGSLRREKLAEGDIRKLEAEIKHLNRLVNLMESDSQRLRMMLKLRDEKLRRLHLLADDLVPSDGYLVDENAAMCQEIQLLQKQINENPQLTQFAFENKRLIEQVRTLQNFHKQGEREMLLTEISLLRNHFLHILEQKYAAPPENRKAQGDEITKDLNNCRKELEACLENNVLLAREVNKLRCELKQYQQSSTNQVAPETQKNYEVPEMQQDPVGWKFPNLASNTAENAFMDAGITTNITESLQRKLPSEIASEDQEFHCHLYPFDSQACDLKDSTKVPECGDELSKCYSVPLGSSRNVLDKAIVLSGDEETLNLQLDEIDQIHETAPQMDICLHSQTSLSHHEIEIVSSSKHALMDELAQIKSINQELREKLVIMAEESTKLAEIIVAKDVEIASLSEEWEVAIVDLTSFLTDGCRSLDDAYQNIDNMINSFPYSSNSVSEHVEKAMKVSIEKEKIISKLHIELQAAQRMGREVKEKLHILRGATLAITEAQQSDDDESSQEALRAVDFLRRKDCNVEPKSCLFAEADERHSRDELLFPDNLDDMSAQHTHNEDALIVDQANADYQSKLDDVLHLVEDKSNKVLALFSNFEEAQETMKEADLMLSALLKANEELKLEKDNCSQAVELLLAEKSSLIHGMHELEASSSCTAQRYGKLHRQMNECVKEMSEIAVLIKESFHQIQGVTTVELFGLFSEIINYGQDLKRCISDSRSYLGNVVSLLEEKGSSSVQQVHHLDADAYTCVGKQVGSRSCEMGGTNVMFLHETQAALVNSSKNIISMTGMAEEGKGISSMHAVPMCSAEELEDSNTNSMHDVTVMKDIIFSIAEMWDVFFKKVSCIKNSEAYPGVACDGQNYTNPPAALARLESEQIYKAVPLQCKGSIEGQSGEEDNTDLLHDVQRLKHHLAQLMVPLSKFINENDIMGYQTGNDKQFVTVLNKVQNSLIFVIDFFSSLVLSDRGGFQNAPSLSRIFHDISNIENKSFMLHQMCLRNGDSQAGYSTDYASLRRDFDRKSDIAEGLSFDLKLLQESTSYARDMKDKAEGVSSELRKVQRELEFKSSLTEDMLIKQKALVEELAENGAALMILRSELEQCQSSSAELLKENNDLRVMLEEEIVKACETKALLEDKAKVIEGLESEILLLNSSEEGRLMSNIEKLNNSIKKISTDNGYLEEEILKLNDRLQMAMALAEENEAAAIEARQAAEISKIYAEEKDEEVTILERSVEELESTITVLEEEVSNLKEEVRSYQVHKQSEAEFQALEGMLPVENASDCDASEELSPGICQLERRLRAEIIAHRDARRKIEGLKMETKRKDEEITQYKEHIAELVLHSEAQSLLFQEKYQEMEHMASKQMFGPHELNSETVHTKIEKPSARTRGSGSPFRCISSIVQQMNSEKDQEISLARQRIEELEALLSNKQKEICLLTARLGAVDSMTHDIIRELLGVKLDMTNYANLLDQEGLHKLLMATQQQIEQSKAKDAELDVLKEQFGHLIQERDSLLDGMDERKTDLLETQLLVEQLEQREQMLEAQNEMLQMEKDNLQQKIMELDETIEELLAANNQFGVNTALRPLQQHPGTGSSEFSRRLAQSDMLVSHARRQEHSRSHAAGSWRTRHAGRR